ncbi:Lycopene beta-cyclase [Aulographum hederae CBS 113979]|uniref:Bifunctional lycopene cyclase/phytoene synthase n=1 Tax=Aulographum hederae CBS 113979 TaxID=1176131 RepID=A0A6G1GSA6_9PEZI|nr:Lycopene beta-cyclase [Aulographum hederae CBS 113979]
MGYEYALVHVKYTIPPALTLTFFYRPLWTRLDVYKVLFLISIAVISTIPWDSYLIRTRIWTYPSDVVLGPTLFQIPLEELFFFVIQTYITSLLYLILSKPTFHPVYLHGRSSNQSSHGLSNQRWILYQLAGQIVLGLSIKAGLDMVSQWGTGTYMGLIIIWAAPFLLLLWSLAYQFIIGLPISNTLWPIFLPTFYLWMVDTFALQRGTWVIESGTKYGIHLWDGLDIEEAFFFLATNTLIVFGLLAFDNAVAIVNTFPHLFPEMRGLPSPQLLVKALLQSTSSYEMDRLSGLNEASTRLQRKSRSFFLASGFFEGRLRIDLLLLYSFCRVADDLVDESPDLLTARDWIEQMRHFLDLRYETKPDHPHIKSFVESQFPPEAHSALLLLPTAYLSKEPLYDLLSGFETDLEFSPSTVKPTRTSSSPSIINFPMTTQADLDLYASRVAGTVAHLLLDLIVYHTGTPSDPTIFTAGSKMGTALQYVNIARDIAVDARLRRVYIPTSWLASQHLTPEAVLKNPRGERVEALRKRLLRRAWELYGEARPAVEKLPGSVRGGVRVAVESYMEIGRVLGEGNCDTNAVFRGDGRATVKGWRRAWVAWKALSSDSRGKAWKEGTPYEIDHKIK